MATTVVAPTKSLDKKTTIFWLITVAVPLIVMLIPTGEVFNPRVRLFLAITVCAILIFAFETLPQLASSILLPIAYVLSGLAPSQAVFGPWTSFIPWMFLGGILAANCLESVGLLRRVAYWCIIKTGGTYTRILFGIMIAGIIMNLLVPAQAIIPLAAFTFGICKALGLEKSPEAAGIMLTGAMAALMPLFFFYNPNFAIIPGAASTVYSTPITWVQYFYHNIPNILWSFFLVFLLSKVFKPEKPIDAKDYIQKEYQKLGKLTTPEKKGIFVTILLFVFMITAQFHRIEIGWGFAIAGCLMFFPGINIGTENDVTRIKFSLVFFVTACMSIGVVANVLGFGKILTGAMLPVLQSSGTTASLGLVWLLCVLANFLMTPLAIMAAFTAPLTQLAINLGIDPRTFFYIIFHAVDQIVLPYEYVLVLIFFAYGLIRIKDFAKFFSIKMGLNIIYIAVILIPYWKLIGLL
jgi:solute carrier family 13 (sodium-dependent dicarboxylate transporter), member 2/3/5